MSNKLKSSSNRSHILDSLKGICIFLVTFSHLSFTGEQKVKMAFAFWVDLAVPMFMIITGYLYTLSYKKRGGLTHENIKNHIIRSLITYTVPYALAFSVQSGLIMADKLQAGQKIVFDDYFWAFLRGGWGPGSYYYPILFQLVFMFPIVYYIIDRYKESGLVACFFINFGLEIAKYAIYMKVETYRLLAFRYFFMLAMGSYVAIKKGQKLTPFRYCMYFGGFAFIYATQKLGFQTRSFTMWTTTCMISAMFALPLFVFVERKLMNYKRLRLFPLEWMGEASYCIFLTQLVLFGSNIDDRIVKFVLEKFHHAMTFNQIAVMSLLFSFGVGIGVHYALQPLIKLLCKRATAPKAPPATAEGA